MARKMNHRYLILHSYANTSTVDDFQKNIKLN